MSRKNKLLRNPLVLFWGKSFIELNILNAVVTLFYLHRGVNIENIFHLSIVWSLTALVFEVPTGYLADRFGRKNTLLLGTILLLLSWAATFFGYGFLSFVIIFVLMSASFACFSGTEEAILYDSLKEVGDEGEMTKHNGRLHSAQHLFNIFIPAIGAWIARDLNESQFMFLVAINILSTIVGLVFLAYLVEPKHVKSVTDYEKGIFRESLETIRHEPFLLRAAMNKLLIFIASFITWRAYQPFLSDKGLSIFWLGVFYVLLHGIIFIMHQNIGSIEKRLGTTRVLHWSVIFMIIGLLGIFITNQLWLIFIFILIPLIFEVIREPIFAHAMNQRINSRSRATTLSNLNIFKAVLDIPILLLCGWLSKTNLQYIFIIAISLCIITLICFSVRKKDLILATVPEELLPL